VTAARRETNKGGPSWLGGPPLLVSGASRLTSVAVDWNGSQPAQVAAEPKLPEDGEGRECNAQDGGGRRCHREHETGHGQTSTGETTLYHFILRDGREYYVRAGISFVTRCDPM
jgi:hypothetical protein